MTANTFNEKAQPPAMMDANAYRALLEALLANGEGYGKTQSVGGYLLQDIKLVTETSSGKGETTKNIAVEKLYVTMDTEQYPSVYLRNLVIQDITKKWGGKLIQERDLNAPEFSGPGLWTLKKGAFEGDYMPSGAPNTYAPNPEAYRVTLATDKPVNIPVQWDGGFVIETGGTVAIRQKDVPAVAEALRAIRAGEVSAEDALLTKDAKGNVLAKFDIYGMEPGFLEKNYAPVALNAETKAIAASLQHGAYYENVTRPPQKPGKGITP